MRKSQDDTWKETPGRYIRFYDKQNKVRFTHSKTFGPEASIFNYDSVMHFSEH